MSAEVLVATTWHCNLRCSYCFLEQAQLGGGGRRGQRMSRALAARVVEALDSGLADVESICLHLYGGEPLTNLPALEAMLEAAEAKPAGRFTFAITTNGTCGSPRAIDLLARGRFQVVLSVDGPPEVHDACRRTAQGAPTHARVLGFLDKLRARTPCEVRVSAVVRPGWRLADAVAYLEALPAHSLKAQAVRGPEGSPWTLPPAEKAAYLADLRALGRKVIAAVEAGETPKDDRFSRRVLQLVAGIEREAFCAAGDTTFGVTPSGDVLPCVLMEGDGCRLGHVDDDPASWREAGRRWRRARPLRPECADCAARPLCGGGCPALMPVCGADECDLVRENCAIATAIYEQFRATPADLLVLAGL